MTKHLETLALRGAGLPLAPGASLLMPRPRAQFEPSPVGETPRGLEVEESEVATGTAVSGSEEASSRYRRASSAAEADRASRGGSRRSPTGAPRVTAVPLQRPLQAAMRGRRRDARPEPEDAAAAVTPPAAMGRGDRSETLARTSPESAPRPSRPGDRVHGDAPARGMEPSPAAQPVGERSRAPRADAPSPRPQQSSDQEQGEVISEKLSRAGAVAVRAAADGSAAAEATGHDQAMPPTEPAQAWPTRLEPAPPPATPGPPEAAPLRPEPAGTAVQVTIGRIEVEVAPPRAPQIRARPAPRRGFEGYGPARRGRLR